MRGGRQGGELSVLLRERGLRPAWVQKHSQALNQGEKKFTTQCNV